MIRPLLLASCWLVLVSVFYFEAETAIAAEPDPPEGFRALFNGTDLEGWHGDNPHTTVKALEEERQQAVAAQQEEFKQHWHVEDGELVNDGHGPYATTDDEFGDIEFHVDYKTVPKADSGIYLRGTPQVQIWDYTEEGGQWKIGADKGSGGLFNNSAGAPGRDPLTLADKPIGEWNRFRITQLGSRTTVYLNNKLVVDNAIMENYWDKSRRTPLPPRGPIHLQTHGGEIRWRNLFVREMAAEEANASLRGDDEAQGFMPIFNGSDLSGWTGSADSYEVRDGLLVCKPDGRGVLFTEEEYGDFVVRFEFKLPAGGNNGLAIRYPGQGQASRHAMCELQILDDTAEKYAQLDPRQYHGAAYGMVPPHRGYLRPVGQWNYQEVTVKGPTVRVELNGTVILDADLSQVTEFKDNDPHPGKDRTHGYFGLIGHRNPVVFRRIAIKRLESGDQP